MFARASPVAALCFGSIYYTEWNGEAAACMCRGIIMKALKKSRSVKPSYLLDEDNHPSGYKSSMALVERGRLHIRTIDWPRYSPGLMPLDFSFGLHLQAHALGGAEGARDGCGLEGALATRSSSNATQRGSLRRGVNADERQADH